MYAVGYSGLHVSIAVKLYNYPSYKLNDIKGTWRKIVKPFEHSKTNWKRAVLKIIACLLLLKGKGIGNTFIYSSSLLLHASNFV